MISFFMYKIYFIIIYYLLKAEDLCYIWNKLLKKKNHIIDFLKKSIAIWQVEIQILRVFRRPVNFLTP
jgi:hypothetical protein